MPRNPPKPTLHGNSSRAYRDYYRELDDWHEELAAHARRNNLEMKIQKRKNLKAAKNPAVVARNERNRTKAPTRPVKPKAKGSGKAFFPKSIEQKVGQTSNALAEQDMRGELADTNRRGDKGTIRIQNKWGTIRKRGR